MGMTLVLVELDLVMLTSFKCFSSIIDAFPIILMYNCFLNSILLGLQAPPLVPISTNISIMRPNAVVTAWNMQYFYTGTAWCLCSFNNHTFVFEKLSGASGSSGLNGAVISIS